jgi:hypothetical protein
MTAVKSGQAMHSSVTSLDAFPPQYYWHLSSSSSYHIHATCLDLIAVIVLGTSKVVPVFNHLVPKDDCSQRALQC